MNFGKFHFKDEPMKFKFSDSYLRTESYEDKRELVKSFFENGKSLDSIMFNFHGEVLLVKINAIGFYVNVSFKECSLQMTDAVEGIILSRWADPTGTIKPNKRLVAEISAEFQKEIDDFQKWLANEITIFLNSDEFEKLLNDFLQDSCKNLISELSYKFEIYGLKLENEYLLEILNEVKSEEVIGS
jgi:hypothetical protein